MATLSCYWPRAIIHVHLRGSGLTASRWRTLLPGCEVRGRYDACIDVTHRQRLQGGPELIAAQLARRFRRDSADMRDGWGVSGNKPVARYAASLAAGGGLLSIAPWQMATALRTVPLTALADLDAGTRRYLARQGLRSCGDVAAYPVASLLRHRGAAGKQLWQLCRGYDVDLVDPATDWSDRLVESRVLPPQCNGRRALQTYLSHMSGRLAARLRRLDANAGSLDIALRFEGRAGGAGERFRLQSGEDYKALFPQLAVTLLRRHWRGEVVTHIRLVAEGVARRSGQLELFALASGAQTKIASRTTPSSIR